jgi:hypothetical protein
MNLTGRATRHHARLPETHSDQGAEVGKAGHTFAFEFVFPSNRLDDLADDLRQPTQGMCFRKRDVIGRRFQEVAVRGFARL